MTPTCPSCVATHPLPSPLCLFKPFKRHRQHYTILKPLQLVRVRSLSHSAHTQTYTNVQLTSTFASQSTARRHAHLATMPQTLPTRYERRSSIASSTASQSPPPRTTSLPESPGSFRVERPSALMSRLNRLSNSTSRPNLPSPPLQEDSYTSRAANAMRSVSQSGKDVLRRTGLGAWAGGSSANNSLAVTEQDEQGEDDDFKPPLARSAGWPLPPHMSPQPPHLSPRINASASLDTSSILYATMSNHPPPLANLPLLVLNLAALAAVPTPVTNDVLLATVLRRLEPWVGDEGEAGYTLIVLAAEEDAASSHGKRRALPGVTWWIWNWRRIPRKYVVGRHRVQRSDTAHRYRKNLKRLVCCQGGVRRAVLIGAVHCASWNGSKE